MLPVRDFRVIPPQVPPDGRLSCIKILIPFAVDNFAGPHYCDYRTFVTFDVLNKSKRIAEYDLNFARHAIPITFDPGWTAIRLYPDNHGITAVTNASVFLSHFIPTGADDVVDRYEIVDMALGYVNPLLDFYALATNNFGIRSISLKDIMSVQLFSYVPDDPRGSSVLSGMFPFDFDASVPRRPDTAATEEIAKRVAYYNALDDNYKFAYRVYSQAMRAFAADDLRLAAIQAVVCLEGSVLHYVKARMREKKDKFNKIRVSVAAYEESKKDVPFSFMLKSLFPLLVPDEVAFPKDDSDACDRLRKKRNAAIHEPARFSSAGLEEELRAVDSLLRFLVASHPRPADSKAPGPPTKHAGDGPS